LYAATIGRSSDATASFRRKRDIQAYIGGSTWNAKKDACTTQNCRPGTNLGSSSVMRTHRLAVQLHFRVSCGFTCRNNIVSYGFGASEGRRARGTRWHLARARHPGSRPPFDRPSTGARPRARRSATLERVQKLDVRACGAREPVGGSRGGRTNGRSGLVFSQGPSRQFSGAIHWTTGVERTRWT
jgi:hypothetical protein